MTDGVTGESPCHNEVLEEQRGFKESRETQYWCYARNAREFSRWQIFGRNVLKPLWRIWNKHLEWAVQDLKPTEYGDTQQFPKQMDVEI